jgi:hypothetical protein
MFFAHISESTRFINVGKTSNAITFIVDIIKQILNMCMQLGVRCIIAQAVARAGFWSRVHGFFTGRVYMGFVMDEVALEQISL